MRWRARTLRSLIVVGLVVVPFVVGDAAFAAVGHFRHSHGEPLNDPRVTPGATFDVSTSAICRSGYSSSVRNVPQSEKDRVYAEYGILHHSTNQYEIDHLIALELGGSNAVSNLWPELNDHPRGYLNSKDLLENRLHSLVCSGSLPLGSAQRQISSDWVLAYHRYLGTWPSGRPPTPVPTTARGPVVTSTSTATGVGVTVDYSSVAPGAVETLTALSHTPHDSCNLTVALPSGRQSTADGLGTVAADARGEATWTWRIGSRTDAGTARFTVTCRGGVAHGTFVIS